MHLDVCLEILTFERDCITTYDEYGIGEKYCSEWFLVGSRMVGNCWAGGGGGGSENYTPYWEDGIDCRTFEFTQTASDWQEAGVKNSRVNLLWLGGSRTGEYIPVTITAPVIIGLPLHFSAGKAANLAAKACSYGEHQVYKLLKRHPTRPTEYLIDKTYREAVEREIRKYGGRSGRVRPNMPSTIVINDAQYRLFGNGDCD